MAVVVTVKKQNGLFILKTWEEKEEGERDCSYTIRIHLSLDVAVNKAEMLHVTYLPHLCNVIYPTSFCQKIICDC